MYFEKESQVREAAIINGQLLPSLKQSLKSIDLRATRNFIVQMCIEQNI